MSNSFEHYAAVENMYSQIVSPVCAKHDLTYMEFTVLMFLANNPQYNTATEIVKYRHLTKSHVSISVRSLQERGLLSGEFRERDRRTIHLCVLEQAKPVITDGIAAQKKFRQVLFAGFTDEEQALMTKFMERINQNIELHTKKNNKGE